MKVMLNETIMSNEEPDAVSVVSTKRPTTQTKKFTKRQKRKTREENLLEKAITIMKSASNTSKPILKDADDVFGEYVTYVLKNIKDKGMKQ